MGRSGSTEAQTVQRRPVSPCQGTGFCRRGQLRVLRPHVAALGPDCPWSSPAAGGACAPAGFAHSCAEGRAALAPATGHFAQRPGVSRARGFPRGLPDSADPRFRPSQGGAWGPACPGVGVPWRWARGTSLRPLRRPRLRGTGSRVVRGAVIQRPLLAAGLSRARTLIRAHGSKFKATRFLGSRHIIFEGDSESHTHVPRRTFASAATSCPVHHGHPRLPWARPQAPGLVTLSRVQHSARRAVACSSPDASSPRPRPRGADALRGDRSRSSSEKPNPPRA